MIFSRDPFTAAKASGLDLHHPHVLIELPGLAVAARHGLVHVVVQEAQPVVELGLGLGGHAHRVVVGVERDHVTVLRVLLAVDAEARAQDDGFLRLGARLELLLRIVILESGGGVGPGLPPKDEVLLLHRL